MKLIAIIFLSFTFIFNNLYAQETENVNKSEVFDCIINKISKDGKLTFIAEIINKSDESQEFLYEFLIIKRSKSGNNTNRQSNKTSIGPNQKINLGKSTVNIDEDLTYDVRLLIYQNDVLVTSKSLQSDNIDTGYLIKDQSENAKNKVAKDANIEFGTFILDETRTRAGRDFYELFYSGWQSTNLNPNLTILIEEQILRGRNTKISIFLEDNLVFVSGLQPRYDILEEQAANAVSRVAYYAKQISDTESDIENEKSYIEY